MAEIEYYYDFGSPNAYIAHKMLPGIAAKHGATLTYRPALLGGIFKATNNKAPLMAFADVAGKVDYIRTEFGRFIERHALAFQWNPHFPVNTLALMRAAVFASGKDWEGQFLDAGFDAMWLNGKDMSQPDVFLEVLKAAGLPAEDIVAATQSPEIKGRLAEVTEAAIARKVFGAPTMFLNDEMFFGKDAMNDLDWRLGQG